MTAEEFNKLSDKQKHHLAIKAMAWFLTKKMLDPFFGSPSNEAETIFIILGKYIDGKLVERDEQ